MGRKVHPVAMRLKITRDWDARWYAEGADYVNLIHEDLKLRKHIKKQHGNAGVSRIEIERQPDIVNINIHTVRPGLIIGRKGEAVKILREALKDLANGKQVKVDVTEIEKPDLDALLVAEGIAGQLERRIGHSRAMKASMDRAVKGGALGIRIEISGRLGGSDMSRREMMSVGRVPRNTLRANIDYGFTEAMTTFGRIGIKVWVYKGDVMRDDLYKVKAQRNNNQPQPEA